VRIAKDNRSLQVGMAAEKISQQLYKSSSSDPPHTRPLIAKEHSIATPPLSDRSLTRTTCLGGTPKHGETTVDISVSRASQRTHALRLYRRTQDTVKLTEEAVHSTTKHSEIRQ
jgi:hypothetical protein